MRWEEVKQNVAGYTTKYVQFLWNFIKRFCCSFRVSVVPSLERLAMKPSTTGLARKLSCHRMTVKNCCRRCTCRVRRLCSIERQSQNFQSKWCVNTYVYYLTIRLILSESASMILTASTAITLRNWLRIFFLFAESMSAILKWFRSMVAAKSRVEAVGGR